MNNPTTNFALADFISSLNSGRIRGLRCFRVNKTVIGMRLAHLLYVNGILRSYKITPDYIVIYYKYNRGRHIISKLSIVSRPGKRVY